MKTSFRTTASVIALAIASLTVPTLAQAKRMGSGGKSVRPASIGKACPARSACGAHRQQGGNARQPGSSCHASNAGRSRRSGSGTCHCRCCRPGHDGHAGRRRRGAVAGSMAGNALAGAMTPEKDAAAKEAEAKAKAAETEAAELQRKADEAKAKAEAARAAAK